MDHPTHPEKRMDSRQHVICPAHLTMDAHEFEAQSLDFSDGGVRLQTSNPLHLFMRLMIGDREDLREADLVWARKNADGNWELGLRYPPESAQESRLEAPIPKLETSVRGEESAYPSHSEAMFPPNFFLRMRW